MEAHEFINIYNAMEGFIDLGKLHYAHKLIIAIFYSYHSVDITYIHCNIFNWRNQFQTIVGYCHIIYYL